MAKNQYFDSSVKSLYDLHAQAAATPGSLHDAVISYLNSDACGNDLVGTPATFTDWYSSEDHANVRLVRGAYIAEALASAQGCLALGVGVDAATSRGNGIDWSVLKTFSDTDYEFTGEGKLRVLLREGAKLDQKMVGNLSDTQSGAIYDADSNVVTLTQVIVARSARTGVKYVDDLCVVNFDAQEFVAETTAGGSFSLDLASPSDRKRFGALHTGTTVDDAFRGMRNYAKRW